MPHDRFFCDSALTPASQVILSDDEARHITQVMRLRIGDALELVNGCGDIAQGCLSATEKRQCTVDIVEVSHHLQDPFEVILAQAIPRINRLDTIIEKGTELGCTSVWLFPGECSERKDLTPQQIARLHAVTVASMKQCGRLYLPAIELKPNLTSWAEIPLPAFYGDIQHSAPTLSSAWKTIKPTKGIIVFIGPEAGFSENELTHLQQLGATGIRLHRHILRTDTAALAALSLIEETRAQETRG